MNSTIRSLMVMILISLAVAGCGSGSGSGGAAGSANGTASTKIAMPYSAEGLPVSALKMTIGIPLGVTVQIDPQTGQAAKTVVRLTGATDPAAVLVAVDYVPATSSARGILKFLVVDPNGFTPSESLTVHLDITPGYFPTESDFTLENYIVTYIDGSSVYNLVPTFTVHIT